MTTTTPSDDGSEAASSAPVPFSITAPPELKLSEDRSGRTTFTVSNLTGRPVRARIVPRGQDGASDDWFDPPQELPIEVGATVTVDIGVTVPADAQAGRYTLHLDAVVEDDTERVAGQSVAFEVPEPAPQPSRLRLILLLVLAGVLLLGLAAGAVWFFFLRNTPPENTTAPVLNGSAVEGQMLQATPGDWEGEELAFSFEWLRCGSPGDCTRIADQELDGYLLTAEDIDQQIAVRVTATDRDSQTASATTQPVGPVEPAPDPRPRMPALVTVTKAAALATLAELGLTVTVAEVAPAVCVPLVSNQNPGPDTPLDPGQKVGIVANQQLHSPYCNWHHIPGRWPDRAKLPMER
jgi:hypothetical protein